jgi:hypothetical protein
VDPNAVRTWARAKGYEIGERGRIRVEIIEAYVEAIQHESESLTAEGGTDED